MVKQSIGFHFFSFAMSLLLGIGASGCSGWVHHLLGKDAPAIKIVEMNGTPLPSFMTILNGEETQSTDVLSQWRSSLTQSFSSIEGKRKDYLSTGEIDTLIRKGFIHLADDQEIALKRVHAVLQLLGYPNGISLANVNSLFDWFENNRADARAFYHLFLANNLQVEWKSSDLIRAFRLIGSFLILEGDQSYSAQDFNQLIQPWILPEYVHAKQGLPSGIEMGIAFFSSLCGDRVEVNDWNGKKVGTCIQDLLQHFTASSPVFDFIFGSLNPIQNSALLQTANQQLVTSIQSWMNGHQHPAFQTAVVEKFADDLSIPPPYQFFKLTEWIQKLNPDSTATRFSPTFFIGLGELVQNWIHTLQGVIEKESCSQEDWKRCPLTTPFAPADQLYSEEYATLIRTKDLNLANRIALYDSIAQYLLQALDPHHTGSLNSGVKDLVTIVIRLMDSDAFAYNVIQQIQEKPISPGSVDDSLKAIRLQGLGEIVALASEILPVRGNNKRTLLKRITSEIYSAESEITYNVDRLGITASLYVYDLLENLRDDYLTHYDLPQTQAGVTTLVPRKKVVEALPRLLKDHFPRIFEACKSWGFERSCGIVYSEVLPGVDEGTDSIEPYEMDLITISSIFIESMMNRCDRNENSLIQSDLFDGFDEKDCVMSISEAMVNRLMDAQIVKPNAHTKFLIQLTKNIVFVRWVGKIALEKGTMKGIGLQFLPPFSLFSGPATLGSALSLAGELMNSDKAKAIDAGVIGPHDDPGDELIYLNQITEHHLPSENEAKRMK